MATHDDPRNQYEKNVRDMRAADGIAEADKDAIEEFLKAIDPEDFTETFTNRDGQQETKSLGTVHSYAHNLKRVVEITDTPLTEIDSADEINELMNEVRSGSHPHPSVQDSGYSAGTLEGWQSAVSKFYQYHDEHDVVPHDIIRSRVW